MKKILIVSGHTDMADSVANKAIMSKLAELLPSSKAVYLDQLYPDFKINAQAEQEKLVWADIIVLQFPVFWFSMPSLMHRWMEETFWRQIARQEADTFLHHRRPAGSFGLRCHVHGHDSSLWVLRHGIRGKRQHGGCILYHATRTRAAGCHPQ